jgi:hypothetical protein
MAHQETILWGCIFISQVAIATPLGTLVPIPSLLQQTLQRSLVIPIPHNHILAVMIYPTTRPLPFYHRKSIFRIVE